MAIEFLNVHKSFGDKVVFDDLNLVLQKNEAHVIMGPSGFGKTTLVNMLLGLEKPDSGHISNADKMRISVVFQEDRLLEYKSGLNNILFVNNDTDSAINLMKLVGLEEDINKKVREYSGGMKRRLCLCRALAIDFDLLVLDEPFKGLDDDTKLKVMEIVKQHTVSKTVILVTHDKTEAEFFGGNMIKPDKSSI
jgi:NitT/TauT family transport system ATP-binding protein